MSFNFENLNRKNTVREGIDTTILEFKPLKDFLGQTIRCDGFFFNEGKFGRQVVVVGTNIVNETFLINMPARAVEQFDKINENESALNAMLEGKMCIKDIKMKDTKNGTTTIYNFGNI